MLVRTCKQGVVGSDPISSTETVETQHDVTDPSNDCGSAQLSGQELVDYIDSLPGGPDRRAVRPPAPGGPTTAF